jgi:uncharacterized protein (DUF58 family)
MARRRRARAGFTTRASCLLAAGLTAVLCGLLLGEVDLVRAGVLAAGVPAVAAVVVHRSRLQIANQRSVEPRQAQAGESVTVHLAITNRSRLRTGTLMLEDQLPDRLPGRARFVLDPLGGHETRTVSYRIPAPPRGVYRVGPLRLRLSDPFRMTDLSRSFSATDEFVVAPVVEQLPAVDPPRTDDLGDSAGSHSVGVHGADDQSTREYRIGDDLRKIHWRSSARTGTLMVRQEERPWRGQSTILLDLRAAAHVIRGDAPAGTDPRLASSLEWAVSAAASIGARFLQTGRETGLLCDPSGARQRFGDSGRLALHLAGVREQGLSDLAPIAGPLRTAARDSALVAVVGRLDPVTLRTLADAHPRGRSSPALAVLLDVDTWNEPDLPVDGRPIAASAEVLRNAGWRVTIARRDDTVAASWQMLVAGAVAPSRSGGFDL